MNIVMKASDPYPVSIFMAGDEITARDSCRDFCDAVGLCVTVTPTTYVYTDGSEYGFIIGLINYPRFPVKQKAQLIQTATDLALKLLVDCNQQSFTIQGPDFCKWFSRRQVDLDSGAEKIPVDI
jgi:ferredoxin